MLSPWQHTDLDISPSEFEQYVAGWVRSIGSELDSLEVTHNQKAKAHDGTYQIDVLATFRAFGTTMKVLVECKKHSNPIPRSYVELLSSRLQSIGAHKGILVATTGFQSGAIEFAKEHGVALVRIVEGDAIYETRSIVPTPEPPPWANLAKFYGQLISKSVDGKINVKMLDFRESRFSELVAHAH